MDELTGTIKVVGKLAGKVTEADKLAGKVTEADKLAGKVTKAKATYENDYNKLVNKPKVEGSELIGDKTYKELNAESLSNIEIQNIINGTINN